MLSTTRSACNSERSLPGDVEGYVANLDMRAVLEHLLELHGRVEALEYEPGYLDSGDYSLLLAEEAHAALLFGRYAAQRRMVAVADVLLDCKLYELVNERFVFGFHGRVGLEASAVSYIVTHALEAHIEGLLVGVAVKTVSAYCVMFWPLNTGTISSASNLKYMSANSAAYWFSSPCTSMSR